MQSLTDTGMVNSYFIPCSWPRFSICQANVVKIRICIQFITCHARARIWAGIIDTYIPASSLLYMAFVNICKLNIFAINEKYIFISATMQTSVELCLKKHLNLIYTEWLDSDFNFSLQGYSTLIFDQMES